MGDNDKSIKRKLHKITDPNISSYEEVSPAADDMRQQIADIESAGGDYTAFNNKGKHPTYALGKYQFVPSYHWNDIKKVTGVKNWDEFLKTPKAQEDFFSWHKDNNLLPSVSELKEFNKDGYSDNQIARLVHFKGKEGARKWLENHEDDTTENNVSIDKYVGPPQGATSLESSSLHKIPKENMAGLVEVSAEQESSSAPAAMANSWDEPKATIDGSPSEGISVGVTGKPTPTPKPTQQQSTNTAESVRKEMSDAVSYLSDDILSNQEGMPSSYAQNMSNVPFNRSGSIVNDITNPSGDPKMLSGYLKARTNQLNKKYKDALNKEQSAYANDPGADPDQLGVASAEYLNSIQKLRSSADHILDMQLANQAYEDNDFDAVSLGIKKQMLLGDPRAEQDWRDLNNKRPLDPDTKMAYQITGLNILQSGKLNTLANGQLEIAKKFDSHSDNIEDRLHKDNPEIFRRQIIGEIANEIYKNENALYGTFLSRPSVSEEDMKKAAKKLGFTAEDIANISTDDIPRSAGAINQMAQGFLNTAGNTFAAPIYEASMRSLVRLGIANKDAVERRFRPGWEESSVMNRLFTGNMPNAQHELSMDNPRGIVGTMATGVGDLAGFLLTAEGGTSFLKSTGIIKDAAKAGKTAIFATAAIPSYNAAYQKSLEIFGDSPEKEANRRMYSAINGIIGGAVMMIDPFSKIAKNILGETTAGKDITKFLKTNDISSLTKEEMNARMFSIIKETSKHMGLQVAIPTIQTASGNITDMLMDPTSREHNLSDNVAEAAKHGAVAMFLPSLFSGLKAPHNQTQLNKSMMYDVAKNAKVYREEIRQKYNEGEYTKDEAIVLMNNIDKAATIINTQLPEVSVANGKTLSERQNQDYAWSLLKSDAFGKDLEIAEASSDKAQIDVVKGKISDEINYRKGILEKAGEGPRVIKEITSEPGSFQKSNTGEPEIKNHPGYIASKIVAEAVKDNSESSGNKNKESVPLSSNVEEGIIPETVKNKKNGEENENNQRDNESSPEISETTGRGKNSEVRQADGLEGRGQGRQDRLLSPDVTSEDKGGVDESQQPPIPVPAARRKRRKLANEPEDIVEGEPEGVVEEDPVISVSPVGETRNLAHTKGVFRSEEGTLYKSTESKDGSTSEHEVLSELQRHNNVVRVGAKRRTSEGEAFEIEELTPLKDGDKISIDEAREVMDTLESMDEDGIYANEIELGRDVDGKLKIFDLSMAERRKEGQSLEDYSTASANQTRVRSHLLEKEALLLREESLAASDAEVRQLLNETTEYELDASNPKSVTGKPLTPIPTTKATTHRTAMRQTREWDSWLLENAKNIVKGNSYLETIVNAIKPTGKSKMLTTADRETLNDLLFGDAYGVKINYESKPKEKAAAQPQEDFDFDQLFNSNAVESKEDAPQEANNNLLKGEVDRLSNKEIQDFESKLNKEKDKPEVKDNKQKIIVGDELGGKESSIGAINRKRRAKKIKGYEDAIETAKMAKKIAEENGYSPEDINASQKSLENTPKYKSKSSGEKMQISLAYEKAWEYAKEAQKKAKTTGLPESSKIGNEAIPESLRTQIGELKEKHPKAIVIVPEEGTENYNVYGEDATTASKILGNEVKEGKLVIAKSDLNAALQKIIKAGHEGAIIDSSNTPKEKPRRKVKKKKTEFQERKSATLYSDPMSFKEAVLQFIISGERINPDDIKHDLGYRASDMRAYLRRVSKKGTSVDHFVERFMKHDGEGIGGLPQLIEDAQDARREFMDIWAEYAHDENKTLDELERLQGRGYEVWEQERYVAQEEGAKMMDADDTAIDAFIEQGNFQAIRKADQQIQNAKLSDSDSETLISYLGKFFDNGVVDSKKAFDAKSEEFAAMYKELGPAGKSLIDTLLAENETAGWIELSPEEREVYNNLKQTTNERFQKQTTSISEKAPQGSASEGVASRSSRGEDDASGRREKAASEGKTRTVKDIDLELKVQRQSQKMQGQKRSAAEKSGDVAAANIANANWFKKQERIERLEVERSEFIKEQERIERESKISDKYDEMANKMELARENRKKNMEGVARSGMLPLPSSITEPISDFVFSRIIEGVRNFKNIHVAIDRGIRLAREKFGSAAKDLPGISGYKNIREALTDFIEPQEYEPILSLNNEEIAKDYLADIRSGLSYEDAITEILSDTEVGDVTKAKVINYIDWHLTDQKIHNAQTLREPQNGRQYIDGYALTGSGETSAYLSGKTLSDVHGQDVQFDINSKETQLEKNILEDTANIVGLAKMHSGSNDPLVFGGDILQQVNRMPHGGDNSIKKLIAVTGLNQELHAERIRVEEDIKNAKGQSTAELTTRLRQLNRMISQVELHYRDITSNASDVLNAARANRVFRDTYFHDLYAAKILTESQQRDRQKKDEALVSTKVEDSIAEEGAMSIPDKAEEMVDHVLSERQGSEAGNDVARDITGKSDKRQSSESGKKKTKSAITRIKERFTKKESKSGDVDRKEVITKEVAEKKAKEFLKGSSIEDLYQKAKEQTKNPC